MNINATLLKPFFTKTLKISQNMSLIDYIKKLVKQPSIVYLEKMGLYFVTPSGQYELIKNIDTTAQSHRYYTQAVFSGSAKTYDDITYDYYKSKIVLDLDTDQYYYNINEFSTQISFKKQLNNICSIYSEEIIDGTLVVTIAIPQKLNFLNPETNFDVYFDIKFTEKTE